MVIAIDVVNLHVRSRQAPVGKPIHDVMLVSIALAIAFAGIALWGY